MPFSIIHSSRPFWYLWKNESKYQNQYWIISSVSLAIINMLLSWLEYIARFYTIYWWHNVRFHCQIHFLFPDFLRSSIISYKYGLAFAKYPFIDEFFFLLNLVFNISTVRGNTNLFWFSCIYHYLFLIPKVSKIFVWYSFHTFS